MGRGTFWGSLPNGGSSLYIAVNIQFSFYGGERTFEGVGPVLIAREN